MTPLTFRLATPDDGPSIQDLVQSAFRAADTRKNWTADLELGRNFSVELESVLATIKKPNRGILLAFTGVTAGTDTLQSENGSEHLVASVEITKKSPKRARFSLFAVHHQFQQGGIGRRVLAQAELYCQEKWGSVIFELDALSTREELIAWYERQGYEQTGMLTSFPVQIYPDLDLSHNLAFVEMEKCVKLEVQVQG
ncbi:uncharacterized protein N7483_004750 [Penicillium malachiteum]|uniref:uncharacterized protein n=1 Tax=Penicillium malachiteum TaxID=1324776 RepID=UPI002547DA82|nr:uncharacterized protein N7483_004750 [Penicillium malachiteum]KAJ5730242.1 hypothetical protein N7483_004750 [Penicillium malachiteum]